MRRRKGVLAVIGAVTISLVTAGGAFAQCSMCQTALLASPEGQKMAAGFNEAILFLLGAPYLVFAATAFLVFNALRQHRNQRLRRDPAEGGEGRD